MAVRKGKTVGGRPKRSSVDAPPGLPGGVLVDRMPYGRLLVGEHRWDAQSGEIGAGKFSIAGEAVAVDTRAIPGGAVTNTRYAGKRSLTCVWEPGPRFRPDDVVRLVVSLNVSLVHTFKLQGAVGGPNVALGARGSVACDALGKRERFAAAAKVTKSETGRVFENRDSFGNISSESLAVGEIGAAMSRAHTFTASDTDELRTDKLASKAFVAATTVENDARASGGLSVEANTAVTARWSVAVTISTVERAS